MRVLNEELFDTTDNDYSQVYETDEDELKYIEGYEG